LYSDQGAAAIKHLFEEAKKSASENPEPLKRATTADKDKFFEERKGDLGRGERRLA